MRTFVLFANIVPVRGAKRATLCDLQRGRMKLIPNDLYTLLTKYPRTPVADIKAAHPAEDAAVIDEYYQFLLSDEWGFETDEPEAFPSLDLTYDAPATITNAIIDVTEESAHDYAEIIRQLTAMGCWFLQVRAWCALSQDHLEKILDVAKGSRLRSVEIFCRYHADQDDAVLRQLAKKHIRLFRLVVHGAPYAEEVSTRESGVMGKVIYQKTPLNDHHSCGVIDRNDFISELYTFAEAMAWNSCLNRKMSIDAQGHLRQCPSMAQSFGHVRDTALAEVAANPAFREIWSVSKDQVAVCRDCEFRYVCTDCRAYTQNDDPFGKPAKCCYDPYTATWQQADSGALIV